MKIGNFYFLRDNYFIDFPDPFLMRNKEVIRGTAHDRPCFYSFQNGTSSIYWMIPFSSNVIKFKNEYQKKIMRYGRCDTIVFGNVLGHTKAFLIQNMCPIIPKYIKNEYIDPISNTSVRLDGVFEQILISKAKRVLFLERRGKRLIFPDVLKIERALFEEIESAEVPLIQTQQV